jgi:hypothetical protein
LLGAVSGYRAFSSICANGDTVFYCIADQAGANWECGLATWNTGGTLTRAAGNVLQGSAGVATLTNFSSGTQNVYIDALAGRGIILSEQYCVLAAAYTLTSQPAAQKLFNSSTNGALTLPIGTYEFECLFTLSSMSVVSSSFGFALGGTATFTQEWYAEAIKSTNLNTPTGTVDSFNTAANVALVTANTSTGASVRITGGIIRVTVAGTIIPQVSLGVAAAAVVEINSFFRIRQLGGSTVALCGNWS